jgi:hypothetical protein
MKEKSIFYSWKKVFGDKKYVLISLLVALGFYLINALIAKFRNIKTFYSILSFREASFLSVKNLFMFNIELKTHSFISLIIISVLLGTLVSFVSYKTKSIKVSSSKNLGVFSTVGVFLGIIAPGCAACGVGLASILGFSAFLVFLPFEGLELSILSIILLLVANYKISKGLITENVCKIKFKENKR